MFVVLTVVLIFLDEAVQDGYSKGSHSLNRSAAWAGPRGRSLYLLRKMLEQFSKNINFYFIGWM